MWTCVNQEQIYAVCALSHTLGAPSKNPLHLSHFGMAAAAVVLWLFWRHRFSPSPHAPVCHQWVSERVTNKLAALSIRRVSLASISCANVGASEISSVKLRRGWVIVAQRPPHFILINSRTYTYTACWWSQRHYWNPNTFRHLLQKLNVTLMKLKYWGVRQQLYNTVGRN